MWWKTNNKSITAERMLYKYGRIIGILVENVRGINGCFWCVLRADDVVDGVGVCSQFHWIFKKVLWGLKWFGFNSNIRI